MIAVWSGSRGAGDSATGPPTAAAEAATPEAATTGAARAATKAATKAAAPGAEAARAATTAPGAVGGRPGCGHLNHRSVDQAGIDLSLTTGAEADGDRPGNLVAVGHLVHHHAAAGRVQGRTRHGQYAGQLSHNDRHLRACPGLQAGRAAGDRDADRVGRHPGRLSSQHAYRGHGSCLLYTSDAADEEDSVDLGG